CHAARPSLTLRRFPTRRSSDLAIQRQIHQTLVLDDLADLSVAGPHERRRFSDGDFLGDCADVQQKIEIHMLSVLKHDPLADLRPDRKSTRLNSSHQIISYAVFC